MRCIGQAVIAGAGVHKHGIDAKYMITHISVTRIVILINVVIPLKGNLVQVTSEIRLNGPLCVVHSGDGIPPDNVVERIELFIPAPTIQKNTSSYGVRRGFITQTVVIGDSAIDDLRFGALPVRPVIAGRTIKINGTSLAFIRIRIINRGARRIIVEQTVENGDRGLSCIKGASSRISLSFRYIVLEDTSYKTRNGLAAVVIINPYCPAISGIVVIAGIVASVTLKPAIVKHRRCIVDIDGTAPFPTVVGVGVSLEHHILEEGV